MAAGRIGFSTSTPSRGGASSPNGPANRGGSRGPEGAAPTTAPRSPEAAGAPAVDGGADGTRTDGGDGDRTAPVDPSDAPGPETGSGTRSPRYPEDSVKAGSRQFRADLDRTLAQHGLDRKSFRRLVNRPMHKLSSAEVDVLLDIRNSIPELKKGDIVEKVVPFDGAQQYLATGDAEVTGFVVKFEHLTRFATRHRLNPRLVFQKLGLGYDSTPFSLGDNHTYAIRFELGDHFDAAVHVESEEPTAFLRSGLDFGKR